VLYLAATITVMLTVALQHAWPPWLQVAGTTPHLGIIVVIGFGLMRGPHVGVVLGFVAAFLSASTGDAPMGNLFISHMLAGFGAGVLRGGFFSTRISVAVLVAVAASLVATIVALLLVPPARPRPWLYPMVVRAAYTGLWAIPLFALIRWLTRRLTGEDDEY
jgi:hypothetical protein